MTLDLRPVAAAALLLLAGCGGAEAGPEPAAAPSPAASGTTVSAPSPTPSPRATSTQPSSAAPMPVPATLRFTATTVDGRAFDGASLAGEPALLWFWAPWCPTCRGQVDQVQAVARAQPGVAVVGVGSLDDAAAIERFAADASGITHLSDTDGTVFRHFEVTQQSSFVLLDARGEKIWSAGYGGSDDLADRVAAVAG